MNQFLQLPLGCLVAKCVRALLLSTWTLVIIIAAIVSLCGSTAQVGR